jgi:carbon-monoxide dehydrogenase large subunit
MDPADVRRVNVIREFPYETANGLLYDPGSYAESLEQALEISGYEQHRTTGAGTGRIRRGYGIALYNEQTSHGTPDFATRGGPIETGYESMAIRVQPDGMVLAQTGMQSHGQSMETTFAQIIADELGVGMESIRLEHGDTTNSPYCVGTWGSRGAALGGGAAASAAREVRAKILDIAAHRLEANPEDLDIVDGRVFVRGAPQSAVTVAEIGYIANRLAQHLPPGMPPGLEAVAYVDGPPRGTFSNACHIAVVDVDTWTGLVKLSRYVVVEDCGTIINPMIVDGQVHGGVAQGVGTALLEELVYSPDGQPTTSTFMDYLMPSASVLPDIEVHHLETPSPWTERGIKGMGESGTIGPMASVANAVSDALGMPANYTPLRPTRVWHLLQNGSDAEALWQRWSQHPGLSRFWPAG